MPTFRKKPVTCLFVLASAVVVCVLLATPGGRSYQWNESILGGSAIAWTYILGACAVAGRAHRLVRGALFVCGAGLIAAFLVMLFSGGNQTWAAVAVLQALAAAAAGAVRLVHSRLARPGTSLAVRFPVIELFGWTIVVAIGSLVIRETPLRKMLTDPRGVKWFLTALLSGAAVALALMGGDGRFATRNRSRQAQCVAIALLIVTAIVGWNAFSRGDRDELVGSVIYTLLFVGCVAVDGVTRPADPPPTDAEHELP